MRAGQDPPGQLEPSFSPGLEPTITSDPLHLHRALYLRPEVGLDAIGSKLLDGNFNFGISQTPRHLPGLYEDPPHSFVSPGLSVVHSLSAGAASAIDSPQYEGASDFPVLLGQLPSFSSAGCCDIFDAKIPLFLPSQTPNRDLSPRNNLSLQASAGLQNERTSPLSTSPQHSRAVSRSDHPHAGPLCTSVLQNFDANNLEEAISLHDGRSLHSTKFTTPKLTMSLWLHELGSDAPRTPTPLNHGPLRYQSAERSGSLRKRDWLGSGCATNETKSPKALHARGDSRQGEIPVRVQERSGGELASWN